MHLGLFNCWQRLPACLPLRLRLPLHPALFVYNLNVVFVCCRSVLPAKNSLSLSLPPSLPLSLSRTKAFPLLPPPPPPFQTKRQIFPPNAVSHSMDGHLFVLAGKMRRDVAQLNFRGKQEYHVLNNCAVSEGVSRY